MELKNKLIKPNETKKNEINFRLMQKSFIDL